MLHNLWVRLNYHYLPSLPLTNRLQICSGLVQSFYGLFLLAHDNSRCYDNQSSDIQSRSVCVNLFCLVYQIYCNMYAMEWPLLGNVQAL
jgi:hypothetical protein